jgi:hypothetical protein
MLKDSDSHQVPLFEESFDFFRLVNLLNDHDVSFKDLVLESFHAEVQTTEKRLHLLQQGGDKH